MTSSNSRLDQPTAYLPTPTDARQPVEDELDRWSRIYAGEQYYYGAEPGPLARRAVRYHRAFMPAGGKALDAGSGEGQDLAFLAEQGYAATGVEFTAEGARKARQLLERRALEAEVLHQDLRQYLAHAKGERGKGKGEKGKAVVSSQSSVVSRAAPSQRSTLNAQRSPTPERLNARTPERPTAFDLVLASNTLQFMGADALPTLDRLMEQVNAGGVIGLSLFARQDGWPEVAGTFFFITLADLLRRFEEWQNLEAAHVWQWNPSTNEPQAFVTLIARKTPPVRPTLLRLE
jgi:SAM-dependent methyltransferase